MAALMGLVFVLAVGMAALKSANKIWAGVIMTLVLGVLLFALLGVAHNSGPTRRFWSGFAVFGWGYLTFIFGPLFDKDVGRLIPTTDLLRVLHNKIAIVEAPETDLDRITIWIKSDGGYGIDGQYVADDTELVDAYSKRAAAKPLAAQWVIFYFDPVISDVTMHAEAERVRRLLMIPRFDLGPDLAPRPEFEYFSRVGHALIALLAGFLGGFSARMLLGHSSDASKRGSDGSAPKTA